MNSPSGTTQLSLSEASTLIEDNSEGDISVQQRECNFILEVFMNRCDKLFKRSQESEGPYFLLPQSVLSA